MIRSMLLASVVALPVLSACGGGDTAGSEMAAISAEKADSPKEYAAVYEGQMIRIADAIEAVEDEASAETAAQIIRDASTELEKLTEKVETMSQMEKARFIMAYTSTMADNQQRLTSAYTKLANMDQEQARLISEAMDNLPEPTEAAE